MGCFSGCLMSTASDQKLFCKLCSPFCCSFNEFVEEKVISPSYSSAILTPPPELWCWRLLRVPWTARRSNQSSLKEISPGCSLEGPMLRLKLQYFGHLMRRAYSFEKTLMLGRLRAGGKGNDRGWDGWMASPTQWTWVWVIDREAWHTEIHGIAKSQTWLSNRTDWLIRIMFCWRLN